MRFAFALILNLLFTPIGFIVLNDVKRFMIFLLFDIISICVFNGLIYIYDKVQKIGILVAFIFVIIIFLTIIVIYTRKSWASYQERADNYPFGKAKTIGLLVLLFILESFIYDEFKTFFKDHFYSTHNIVSRSMEPSVQLGDYIFVNHHNFQIKNGDAIHYIFEESENGRKEALKRVIGIPGDRLLLKDKRISKDSYILEIILNGKTLKNKKIPHPFIQENIDINLSDKVFYEETIGNKKYITVYKRASTLGETEDFGYKEIVLKEGEYFILGDNRNDSYDSRISGPIKRSVILGKMVSKYFSINFKEYTCSEAMNLILDDFEALDRCSTDFVTKILRSKIRFENIGRNEFYDN
ncbi:signal peptidase I [Leptospira yasudae]|uniref:signal peptidase I n=1 Tax=Leptospira yasudae TaxID=2202201 RepID=UPI000E59B482|nr:signal peptidase I [Leptospira yasudae]RHX91623.1 signal peptidase I [Leptospira yasudae]